MVRLPMCMEVILVARVPPNGPPSFCFRRCIGHARSFLLVAPDCANAQGSRNLEFATWLTETQDDKMYRVVMDRERWFNVVMGEQFKVDARSAEALAQRVPLPLSVALELSFRLEVKRQPQARR